MLLFVDSFDYGDITAISKKYTNFSGNTLDDGRFGTKGLKGGSTAHYCQRTIPNSQTVIAGFANKYGDVRPHAFLYFLDAGTVQCCIRINTDLTISFIRGTATILGTTSYTLKSGWEYIETKVYIDNASGTAEIRVNGDTKLSLTGIDNQITANAYANRVDFYPNQNGYIDDIYIANGTGGQRTDFLGDCRVTFLPPLNENDGRGYTDWTPSVGTYTYEDVDDLSPDSDTTYIYASGTAAKTESLYVPTTPSGLVGTSTIYGVSVMNFARKASAGTPDYIQNILYNNVDAVLSGGSQHIVGDNYFYYYDVFEQVPISGGVRDFEYNDFFQTNIETGIHKDGV